MRNPGATAYQSGVPPYANPHPQGTPAYSEWLRQWINEAHRQALQPPRRVPSKGTLLAAGAILFTVATAILLSL